jgi:hypothetical protein
MGARVARIGFFGYAALTVLNAAASLTHRHLVDAAIASHDWSRVDGILSVLRYVFHALSLGSVAALIVASRAPRAARVGGLLIGAAVLEGVGVLISAGDEVLIKSWTYSGTGSSERLEALLRGISVASSIVYYAAAGLVFASIVRVARAASAPRVAWAAFGALGALGLRAVLFVVGFALGGHTTSAPGFFAFQRGAYYVSDAIFVAVCIAAGVVIGRMAVAEPARADVATGDALPPAWGNASGGIALYLGAAAARAVCALLSYAVMSGASGASDFSSLRQVRESIVSVAVLSGIASIAMLAGVWRISRVPPESGGSGPALAALGFGVMGFVLDLVATGIAADALGGDVSAAFFAMDALPVVALLSGVVGVGAALSLLRALGNIARAVGRQGLAERARGTTVLAATTGALACVVMLAIKHLPAELLIVVAFVVLPLACATLVQFLRVAVPLGQAIRARLAPGA